MPKTKKKLTPKQEKYAQNVAKGMSKKDAAIDAGYSEKNAARAGYTLDSDSNPLVKQRIGALQEKAAAIGADAVIEVIYHGPRISFASWGTMEGVGTAVQYENVKDENMNEVSPNNNSEFLPFDDAVYQCEELGLENGTEKFINCVNKLNGRN